MLTRDTGFFNDTMGFEMLNSKVISPILKATPKDAQIRIWVVGCSSGEEVYSIAILFMERLKKARRNIPLKIFATDVDQEAIDFAIKGIYPKGTFKEVNEQLPDRYFEKSDDHRCQINKELREKVVFAKHDVTKDPPFTNIDMVYYRNLLNSNEIVLHEKSLSFIHHALKENGLLCLGSNETLGNYASMFEEIDKKQKLYRKRASRTKINVDKTHPVDHWQKQEAESWLAISSEVNMTSNFKEILLKDMVLPTIIINQKNKVVHTVGDIAQYLKLPKTQSAWNVLKMVDDQLRDPLRNVISEVEKGLKKTTSLVVNFKSGSHSYSLNIIAKSYTEPVSKQNYYIITFNEYIALDEKIARGLYLKGRTEKDAYIIQLEEELYENKEYLKATVEQLETSNEVLQTTNQVLISTNEELQVNNEKLHRVNEELYSLNNEFQQKLIEMSVLNDDLNNFIQSTQIATLFLDKKLNIKRFTNAMASLVRLNSDYIGRYIGDFTHQFIDFDLVKTAKTVQSSLQTVGMELTTIEREVFLLKVRPYQTAQKEVSGVVFTLFDITDLKRVEEQLTQKALELELGNKELAQFAYVSSHDLKAPLTNMTGLMSILEANSGIKDDSIDIFNKIKVSVVRMNNTISALNEVIALKKNVHLESKRVKFSEVLDEVLEAQEIQIKEIGAIIKSDFSGCEWVLYPPIHLQHILQNLISNALKYREKDRIPVVSIKAITERSGNVQTGDSIHLIVKDNGKGIDLEAYGKKLFGLFQRFHLDTEGKGIGLHITKSIVENYKGSIEVKSKVGEGTTFNVKLK